MIFFQIFRIHFFNHFIKNPQPTIALTFLTHIISDIGGMPTYNPTYPAHLQENPQVEPDSAQETDPAILQETEPILDSRYQI